MLGQNEFDTDILSQWWSYEDKLNKSECDMRIFNVRPSELEMNCVNWTDGFSGSICSYSLELKNDFFCIRAKECKKTVNPGFIYGYLSGDNLFLLIRPKALPIDSSLLQEKNWLKFVKIKR